MMSKKTFWFGLGAIVIWSTTFSLSKFVLEINKDPNFNVFTYLALRLMFGLPYLWGSLVVQKKLKMVTSVLKSNWKQLLFLGLISFAGSYIVQYFGILRTSSINQSIILQMQTFFVIFISRIIYKNKINPYIYLGGIAAFFGLYFILTTAGSFAIDSSTMYGDLMSLLAAFLWATFSAISAEIVTKFDRLTVLTIVETIAAIVIIPFAFVNIPGFQKNLGTLSGVDWLILAWLGLVGIGIAYQFWYEALSNSKSQEVIILMYLTPLFSYFFGFIVLTEMITWKTGVGSVLIIGGLLIAQLLHPKKKNTKLNTVSKSFDAEFPKP